MEGQSERTVEVVPVTLFAENKPDGPGNNPYGALPVGEVSSQSATLAPDAMPFVPAISPASPEAAAAASAYKNIIDNDEFKKLQSAEKQRYAKQGTGPAYSSVYQLKET